MADGFEIFIESSLKEKLFKHFKSENRTSDTTILCGSVHGNSIHVSGCISSIELQVSFNGRCLECVCLPQGVKFLGVCQHTSKVQNLDTNSSQDLLKDLLSEKSNDRIHDKLLLWQYCLETKQDIGLVYDVKTSKLTDCSLLFGSYVEKVAPELITFRIQTMFDICVENNFTALKHKVNQLSKDLLSEATTFLIKDGNMLIRYGGAVQDEDMNICADIVNLIDDAQEQPSMANKKTKSKKGNQRSGDKISADKDAVDVKLLTKISMPSEGYKDNCLVPIICYGEECGIDMTISLPVDVVVMATKDMSINELPRLFTTAIAEQLKQISTVIQGFSKEDNWCVPRPYHFKPPGFSYYITIIYPDMDSHGEHIDENILESYRSEIHKKLLLPLNRPLLRNCNRYVFDKDKKTELYLVNPHENISYSGLPNGSIGLVDGHYSYHHYMQDNFNDDKWGCAYRSLQTIASWFRHQGYTSNPVPSHRQIQQALVDIGDKKANFAGSRQWIGSFEVSLCLEHLLGVTSKILFVSSGADMPTKGRELLHHFETQGTPIMIGGGVLAHTIIGVDYSQDTGDIKFLILDPHYTGGEDLKTVLDKGWCGWKGPGFWDQQAHYNMCMPQRPDMI